MKSKIILLVILVSINLIFVPHRTRIVTWDKNSFQTISENQIHFVSPLWSNTYDGHFISFGSFQSKKVHQSDMVDYINFKYGRIISISDFKTSSFFIESYERGQAIKAVFENEVRATGIPTDLHFNPIPSPIAFNIWVIYFLMPSLLIYYFIAFYKRKQI